MPAGKCTRKPKPGLDYFYLQGSGDVVSLMSSLLGIGFNSTLRAYTVSGAATWDIMIEDARPASASLPPQDKNKVMHLGDVAVWDGGVGKLETMRIEDFQTNYSVP